MPNGVDVDMFGAHYSPSDVRTQYNLDSQPVVSFVGSFQHWHGIEILVESFARVLVHLPQSKLLLVGDGPARKNIEENINRLGIGSSVHITGLVPQRKIPEILSAVDVAVIPYPELPNEMWFSPLKLYEYMAAGKAIVASRAGQIAEVIKDGENGRLVESGQIEEFAAVIERLLNSPDERDWMGKNARQQALEQHSWKGYINQLQDVYDNVLNPPVPIKTTNGAAA
jgi:glycosyltransferase involved in cell wall biosynthesis